MKKNGSTKAKASVAKNTAMKMFSMPFCAYLVQISTTFLLSAMLAEAAPSSLLLALINSTAREAPVVTACVLAPVNQEIMAPPVTRPRTKGAWRSERIVTFSVKPLVQAQMVGKLMGFEP